MGTSTDGILVFGFDLGIEDETPEWLMDKDEEMMEFDDFIAQIEVIGSYPSDGTAEDKSAYWKLQREVVAACPIDLVTHCSGEYPMYILAVRGTEMTARRGDPTEIKPSDLVVPKEKIKAAEDYCKKHGIPWEKPTWLLCSYWG